IDGNEPDGASTGAAIPSTPIVESPPTTASLDGIAVLVVDDDAASREVAAAYLEGCGAIVRQAASASEAIEVLRGEPPDVLRSDIALPGEDGYQLIQRVRAMESHAIAAIPAAALTAFARAEDRKNALDAGFQMHL